MLSCILIAYDRFAGKFLEAESLFKELSVLNSQLEEKVAERTKELKAEQEQKHNMMLNIFHDLRSPIFISRQRIQQMKSFAEGGSEALCVIDERLSYMEKLTEELFLSAKLESKGVYAAIKPDVVLYDVLGDVVCGGFAMPMRKGYADKVYIITSGENMSVYAAANIAMALKNFENRNYAALGGFILNRRNVKDEEAKVKTLAEDFNSSITGTLSRSDVVVDAEELHQTVLQAFPDSAMAAEYRLLAENILKDAESVKC
jgi:hypothetical protein